MKKMIFCIAVVFAAKSFSQPRQGTVEYDKQQVPCYIYDMNFPKDVAEDAIRDRFRQMGVNGTDKKGFMEFRNAIVPEISGAPVDVLIKVVKKDKGSSTLDMIVGRPVGATDNTLPEAENSYAFLTTLNTITTDYSLELDIKKQADALKSAQKKSANLADDGNSLQKKLRGVQDDIADNEKRQAAQSEEVKKQQAIYDQMVARRRTAAKQ